MTANMLDPSSTEPAAANPAPSPAPQRGWWRRNAWGLATLPLIIVALLGVYFGDAYQAYWTSQPREPVAAGADGWASFGGGHVRLVEVSEVPTVTDSRGTPVKLSPGIKVWRAVLELRAPQVAGAPSASPSAKPSAATTPSAKTPAATTPSAKTPSPKTPSPKTPSPKTPSAKASSARTPAAGTPSAKTPSAKAPSVPAPSATAEPGSPSPSPSSDFMNELLNYDPMQDPNGPFKNCALKLEDGAARLYGVRPVELSRARLPYPNCSLEDAGDGSTLAGFRVEAFFIMPADARPVALRVQLLRELPRYARLSAVG